jgi:Uma2 family endonuclease
LQIDPLQELEQWERINGVIYDMTPSPSAEHQRVVGNLFAEIHTYLKGKTCEAFVAPFDVFLESKESGNYVIPDITIVCDPAKITAKGCIGVPEMVIEVLSPATGKKDRTVKLKCYRLAGVREYWIVDPNMQTVEVYCFKDNIFKEPLVYDKQDTVPVGIFTDLKIKLSEVFV